MKIGRLGDITFEVSDETIKTISNMQWSGSVRYATHKRHLTNARTEITGIDADEIQFDITISAYLGVNPQKELSKIWTYEREGRVLSLVLGNKAYGKYRWTILKHKIDMQHFDEAGDLTHCTVSLSLLEYLRK